MRWNSAHPTLNKRHISTKKNTRCLFTEFSVIKIMLNEKGKKLKFTVEIVNSAARGHMFKFFDFEALKVWK